MPKIITKNKKAYHDYEIVKTIEAGIVLTGSEIKSLRNNSVDLRDSFARISPSREIFLSNMYIGEYEYSHTISRVDSRRPRKLLLHKKEIIKLEQSLQTSGLTLVPLKLYFKNNYVKVELALARGKKMYDKRRSLKEKDQLREINKQLKYKNY